MSTDLRALVGKTVSQACHEPGTVDSNGRVIVGFSDGSCVELDAAPQSPHDVADIEVIVTDMAKPPAPPPRTLVICRAAEREFVSRRLQQHDVVSAESLASLACLPPLAEYDRIVLKRGALRSAVSVTARRLAAYLAAHPKCAFVSEDPKVRFPPNGPKSCRNCGSEEACQDLYPHYMSLCDQWRPQDA